jgi:hypothetical protein
MIQMICPAAERPVWRQRSAGEEARFRTASGVRPIFSAISLSDLPAIISRASAASSSLVQSRFLNFIS